MHRSIPIDHHVPGQARAWAVAVAMLLLVLPGCDWPNDDSDSGRLAGTIRLESVEGASGSEVVGTFDGTLDGKPAKLALGGARFELDKPIKAGFRSIFRNYC